jgi:hypothetical protein
MRPIALFILLVLTASCSSPKRINYSFFAAGHTYGNPMDKAHPKGLYIHLNGTNINGLGKLGEYNTEDSF